MLTSLSKRFMASSSSNKILGPVGKIIEEKLNKGLNPISLNIIDESYKHAGHAGVGGNQNPVESHFKVEVVSAQFEGQNLVKRHQLIYGLLSDEMKSKIHALSIKAKTPKEVEN